jgi:predicted AlkP superfamily pyrophosphatase or phosphodiesterase
VKRDPALVMAAIGLGLSGAISVAVWLRGDDLVCAHVEVPAAPAPPPHAAATAPVSPTPIAAAAVPTPPPIHHVVIISEDGLRPDALDETLAPRHVALMREGVTAREAETIPESDTLPSHASMLSGVGADAHGLWWNSYKADRGYIHVPTIFAAAHERGLSTAMIVGKPKLQHIAAPGTVDYYERPSYLCGGVSRRAAQYFVDTAPALLFVHFSDPDEYGHSHGWMSKEYADAVKSSDACLARMLSAIDGSVNADTTLVIVTADHGGHGFHHSGGRESAADRDIPWIMRGPGVPRGEKLDAMVSTVDTAATALAALGLPALPNMIGASRLGAIAR